MPVQVFLACGDDRVGPLPNQVVDDGQIVRSKIPQHVHVMLEETQVHAGGVIVVELAQRIVIHKLADLFHGAGEQEGVIHHDLKILLLRQIDQLLSLSGCRREGLLHENVLPIVKRALGQLKMSPDRRDHRDRVDIRRRQ